MRLFTATLATETNSFAPIPTARASFEEAFYAPPGTHPAAPNLCSAPLVVARRRAQAEGWTLIEGSCAWAEPAGTCTRQAYEGLRDEILGQLEAALPLDGVLLGLHGAMVAEGYEDCEGDLIARVRALVGPKAIIGVEHDPHCHLTQKRLEHCNLLITFKEFPHTDSVERAEEVVELTLRAIKGEIDPVMSCVDCRTIASFPTTREPMRSFVDRVKALEGRGGVLSISIVHGFPYADVPDVGARILVVADGAKAEGDALAMALARELNELRGRTAPDYLDPDAAIDAALALPLGKPVVITDPSDNPGGGAAGDSTQVLSRLLARGIEHVAFAPLWDPVAVRLCFLAGEGARLPLRLGGKTAPSSGVPLDVEAEVVRLVADATQSFAGGTMALGDAALIRVGGMEIVLISKRTQSLGRDLFTGFGVELEAKRIVALKSTNHFHAAFAPIAQAVLYTDGGGPIPRDVTKVPYTRVQRPIWPLDAVAEPIVVL
ncbi:MAG: M81 family peptidase [Geminicoccaceae bacterium]|nr:MAG: M81 family peptidase [Geminicoccaceae bacterium]